MTPADGDPSLPTIIRGVVASLPRTERQAFVDRFDSQDDRPMMFCFIHDGADGAKHGQDIIGIVAASPSIRILATPGVVVDGKVVHSGGVPTREKIASWLGPRTEPVVTAASTTSGCRSGGRG